MISWDRTECVNLQDLRPLGPISVDDGNHLHQAGRACSVEDLPWLTVQEAKNRLSPRRENQVEAAEKIHGCARALMQPGGTIFCVVRIKATIPLCPGVTIK